MIKLLKLINNKLTNFLWSLESNKRKVRYAKVNRLFK